MKLASCPSSCGDGSLRLMRLLRATKISVQARTAICTPESEWPSVELLKRESVLLLI